MNEYEYSASLLELTSGQAADETWFVVFVFDIYMKDSDSFTLLATPDSCRRLLKMLGDLVETQGVENSSVPRPLVPTEDSVWSGFHGTAEGVYPTDDHQTSLAFQMRNDDFEAKIRLKFNIPNENLGTLYEKLSYVIACIDLTPGHLD